MGGFQKTYFIANYIKFRVVSYRPIAGSSRSFVVYPCWSFMAVIY